MRRDDPKLPRVALHDPLCPPEQSRLVRCLHCGRVYDSALMCWDELDELWACAFPRCEGTGYGWDIFDEGD